MLALKKNVAFLFGLRWLNDVLYFKSVSVLSENIKIGYNGF